MFVCHMLMIVVDMQMDSGVSSPCPSIKWPIYKPMGLVMEYKYCDAGTVPC